MSLFEDDQYRWRDTYFVMFHEKDRPTAEAALKAFETLGPRYSVQNVRHDEQGMLESLTLISPDDFAAMDVSYIVGEEVVEQVESLIEEMGLGQADVEAERLKAIKQCNARFDIYHFEQVMMGEDDDDEGFFDPGALLIVLQCLATLCKGTGVDPQTGTVVQ
jgi:hypothetical protein